jgi:ADP-ribose pyrophosphatase YjhB (NUDIX family)
VHYENPKIVVGSVVRHEGKILLCRRAIEPRKGYWTIPAGYLELNESPQTGAKREAKEEANADLKLGDLLAVYTVERLSQVQILYRATLNSPEFSAGEESLEVELFEWDEIPWEDIAFPTVHWILEHDRQVEASEANAPFENPEGQVADL